MTRGQWINTGKKYLICVDSYEEGVMKGRIWDPDQQTDSFSSLSQFLLKMEEFLDRQQEPQAYTVLRRFSENRAWMQDQLPPGSCKGSRSTFELKVVFRRNSSWQGSLLWKEAQLEENFRSVLEMVHLMDSALRGQWAECCQ